MNNVAYCPECLSLQIQHDDKGVFFAIANEHHLNTIAEGHKRWAGENAELHELATFKDIPDHLKPLLVIGMLPIWGSMHLGK